MLVSFFVSVFRIMSWSLHPPKLTSGDIYFWCHHELIDLYILNEFQSTDICQMNQ